MISRVLREDLQADATPPEQVRVAASEVLLVLNGALERLLLPAVRAGVRRGGTDVVLHHVRDFGLKSWGFRPALRAVLTCRVGKVTSWHTRHRRSCSLAAEFKWVLRMWPGRSAYSEKHKGTKHLTGPC